MFLAVFVATLERVYYYYCACRNVLLRVRALDGKSSEF